MKKFSILCKSNTTLGLRQHGLLCCLVLLGALPACYADTELVTVLPSSREVSITGFTRARSSMELSSEVEGKIVKVFADIGDQIQGKNLFACLDDTFVIIDIKSAENDAAQHQVDINYYKKQVSRYKKLVAKNSASVSLLDDFERQLNNSKNLKQKISLKKQRLLETKSRHCVEAPEGWLVVERFVEPGQWIESGTQVAIVSDYSSLLVPFALSADELKVLQEKKATLKVFLTNYDKNIAAQIERISPAFDEQSHKIRVDLSLNRELPNHRGGIRVELRLDLPDQLGAWKISKKAVDERFDESWLERSDGIRVRVILLGYTHDGYARITSSELKPGQQFKVLN